MAIPTLNFNKITKPFELYLNSKKLSSNSKRNYLADTNYFLNWFFLYSQSHRHKINFNDPYKISQNITEKVLENYLRFLEENGVSLSTIKRRLSSLRLLGKFFVNQRWWQENKAKKITIVSEKKETDFSQQILERFAKSLKNEGKSQSTIRNYLTDIRSYLDWQLNRARKY